uniref:Uncharacterized protein n=1 Tax=Anopheles albimanus TaxID=7167 RepID=A0A182F1N5_ANOAL
MCDQGKRKKKEKFQYNKSIMAATSVVVLDRGNNTTCTINLHGATVVSWRVNNQEQLFVRKMLKQNALLISPTSMTQKRDQ